jgi:hypothetical protein
MTLSKLKLVRTQKRYDGLSHTHLDGSKRIYRLVASSFEAATVRGDSSSSTLPVSSRHG